LLAGQSKQSSSSNQKTAPYDVSDSLSYYSYLEPLIQHWILEKHQGTNEEEGNPLRVQAELINLVFRAVGGTPDSFLDPETTTVEEMNSEEWDRVTNKLVDDMRYTPEDKVLFLLSNYDLDGKETEEQQPPRKRSATAAKEDTIWAYRSLWDDFWYALVQISLEDGDRNNNGRFALEMVRDWILRLHELLEVSQPDLRGAAVMASLQMTLGVLDRTVTIHTKLKNITERQYQSSATKKNSKKAAALLENQIRPQKRLLEELEAIIDTNISAVFMNRYRDSNPVIRGYTLHVLSQMMLRRPDLYMRDKYLKYIGWTLSDKSAQVRFSAINGLLAPFQRQQEVQNRQQQESQSLLTPVKRKGRRVGNEDQNNISTMLIDDVDLSTCLTNVVRKFLPRLADCTIDVSTRVQEKAMALFLHFDRENFLEDFEDDLLWEQINNRALAKDTTPQVRRDALYFIMDQLEAFDDGLMDEDEDEDDKDSEEDDEKSAKRSRRWSRDKKASLVHSEDTMAAKKIGTLAGWIAHSLTNGPIPLDQIRLSLTDYVVESLRSMPEHSSLVTHQWSAMVRAINDCCEEDTTTTIRIQTAKQRVLIRMLAHAARLEFGEITGTNNESGDTKTTTKRTAAATGHGKNNKKDGPQELFGTTLLPVLPDLLRQFQTDSFALTSLSFLPRYLCGLTTAMSQHTKRAFLEIVQTLAEIYEAKTIDDMCLQTILESLVIMSEPELTSTTNVNSTSNVLTANIRAPEVQKQLHLLAQSLCRRLSNLWSHGHNNNDDDDDNKTNEKKTTKSRRSSKGEESNKKKDKKKGRKSRSSVDTEISSTSEKTEEDEYGDDDAQYYNEFAISSCLQRLSILSKRIDLVGGVAGLSEDENEKLRNATMEGMKRRLKQRQVAMSSEAEGGRDSTISKDEEVLDTQSVMIIPSIWDEQKDSKFHEACSQSVKYTLDFLLVSVAWDLKKAKEADPLADTNNTEIEDVKKVADVETEELNPFSNHTIVRQRDQMVDFLCLCFQQFLPPTEEEDLYSEDHIRFTDRVQLSALQASSDLRTLLPKIWADKSVASPLLRAVALVNDQDLTVASVRYFRSKEGELRAVEDQEIEDSNRVYDLLLPIARTSAVNWTVINRREIGFALAHIVESGQTAQKLLTSLSVLLRGMDPVRLLETHMICLRTSFENWLNSEPAEIESEIPSDDEMVVYEKAEKEHRRRFDSLLEQATCLAATLDSSSSKEGSSGGNRKLIPQLNKPMLGFLKEGIRYAFSTAAESGNPGNNNQEEEDFLPGGRLTFLLLLQDFGNWIRRNKTSLNQLQEVWKSQVNLLHSDPDFDQAHEDDLAALKTFAKNMGFLVSMPSISQTAIQMNAGNENSGGPTIVETDGDGDDEKSVDPSATPEHSQSSDGETTPGSSPMSGGSSGSGGRQSKTRSAARRRLSRGSISTQRSAHTIVLSPLLEEDAADNDQELENEEEEEESNELESQSTTRTSSSSISPTIGRRRRGGFARSSVGSALSMATLDEEEQDDNDDDRVVSNKKRKRRSTNSEGDDSNTIYSLSE